MEPPDPLDQITARQEKTNLLKYLNSSKGKNQVKDSLHEELLDVAKKRQGDNVNFTYLFLKNRLSSELDSTIAEHLRTNPEMKDQFFIGIITEQPFQTEVLNLKDAAKAIVDLPQEEALQILKKHPIGYFKKKDFPLKTPQIPSHLELKKKLDVFFQKHAPVFQLLREHPEYNVSTEDFYTPPK